MPSARESSRNQVSRKNCWWKNIANNQQLLLGKKLCSSLFATILVLSKWFERKPSTIILIPYKTRNHPYGSKISN
jgi:hypothetical protein